MALQPTPRQPDMNAVPPAARAAAARAQELQEQEIRRARGEADPPPAPPAGDPPPAPPPQELTPQPAPAPAPAPAGDPPPAPPAPPPQPETPPQPASELPREQLEHMLRSEQGRTAALRRELQSMGNKLDDLQRTIAAMNRPPETPPASLPAKVEWTQEEIQEWGDALPIIEKKARELIAPLEMKFYQALTRVQEVTTHTAAETAKNARQTMIDTLNKDTSINPTPQRTWLQINEEDDFLNWLEFPEPMTGQRRYDVLMDAWNKNDASRVAATFRQFLKEASVVAPREPAPQPGAQPATPAATLENLAAPGRPRTAAPVPPGPAEPEIITNGDIARFYADKTAGRWKGREAEADEYERKINAAVRAGRVRQGPAQP